MKNKLRCYWVVSTSAMNSSKKDPNICKGWNTFHFVWVWVCCVEPRLLLEVSLDLMIFCVCLSTLKFAIHYQIHFRFNSSSDSVSILTHAQVRVLSCMLYWAHCLQLKRSFWMDYTLFLAQQDLKKSAHINAISEKNTLKKSSMFHKVGKPKNAIRLDQRYH